MVNDVSVQIVTFYMYTRRRFFFGVSIFVLTLCGVVTSKYTGIPVPIFGNTSLLLRKTRASCKNVKATLYH